MPRNEVPTHDGVRHVDERRAQPIGVGGVHHGPNDMLGVWGTINGLYDMRVEPSDFLEIDDQHVVVIGHHRRPARDGNSAVDAAFAHVITPRGDHMAALQQITDTARSGIATPQ